jgi:hypothetical protein
MMTAPAASVGKDPNAEHTQPAATNASESWLARTGP